MTIRMSSMPASSGPTSISRKLRTHSITKVILLPCALPKLILQIVWRCEPASNHHSHCWWSAHHLLTGGGAAWKTEHPHHEHQHGVHVGDEAVAPHVRHLSDHEPHSQVLLAHSSSQLTTSTSLLRRAFGVAMP